MNRREMLTAGIRQLARVLPGLTSKRNLGTSSSSDSPTPPPQEALSFPKKTPEPALEGLNPVKED